MSGGPSPRAEPLQTVSFLRVMGCVSAVLLAAFFIHLVVSRLPEPPPEPTGVSLVKAMEAELKQLAVTPRKDGLAAAILVDTSRSMYERVPGEQGRREVKLEISRRAAVETVRQFQEFARKHPERTVQVGLYEFSVVEGQPPCRAVLPLSAPDLAKAEPAIWALKEPGETLGTPIGDAMLAAYRDLHASGLSKLHLLVLTDGENNHGCPPELVTAALSGLPDALRPALYCIAFDVKADAFAGVRDAGALILSAANATELNKAFDFILSGKILVEQPAAPPPPPKPGTSGNLPAEK